MLGTDTGFFGVLIGVATQIEPERIGRSRAETGRCDPCRNTRRGANAREEQDLGSVEAGKVSMLDADPRTDIRNVARIYRTFKAGVAYEPVDSARPIR